jgi:alkylation response protein AidB-like acyl-CoA dehydrogenase
MALIINEEQQMLKTSAKELLKENGTIANLRKLRDENDATGYDQGLWSKMSEMGWSALAIPEAYGGFAFGYTGLGQVMEEMGRNLTASPLFSTVWLSATAINLGGNVMQKETLLPEIATGNSIVAFASDEGKYHRPHQVKTTARKQGNGYILNGTKTLVLDGHVANKFVVSANVDGNVELFVVDANTTGATAERVIMMDSRNSATVSFENVELNADAHLGEYESGAALLDKTLDIARIGLAAEMLGGCVEAFERTIAYLKEREQFGVPIGSFQALQHRAAIMFGEIELCKSVVIKALKAIDSDAPNLSKLASLAKAKLGATYKLVSNEGIQMFGGIGMTDDEEIGFFMKRARVAQQTLGDTNFHLDRLAKMKGY